MRRWPRLGLQAKISGAIVGAVLLAAAVSVLVALVIARDALHTQVLGARKEAVQGYAGAIDLYLANLQADLEASATLPTVRDAFTAEPGLGAAVRSTLARLAHRASGFEYLMLLDAGGTVLVIEPRSLEAEQSRRDRGFAAWFQQVRRERRTVVSDLFISPLSRRPTVVIATPVVDEGQRLVGVLAGSLSLPDLSRVGAPPERQTASYGFLTDRRGLVIAHQAHPDYSLYQTDLTAVEPVRAALAGGAGAGRFYNPVERTEQFAAWRPMPATGWAVVEVCPVAAVYGPLDELSRALGLAALAVALVLGVLAFAYVRPMVQALRALSVRAEAISVGAGSGSAPVGSQPDELGQLATAFDRMSAALAAKEQTLQVRLDELGLANRALAEANETKDQFLAMLGHELRNPLGAITTAIHYIAAVAEPDELTSRPREVIARQVKNLIRLVDDLLEASRLSTGKVVLDRAPVDLAECATRILASLRATGRLDHHAVTHETAPAWVDADETRLEQIVTNLVTNALKYTPAGGHIRVVVGPDGDVAVLRVTDDGMGIHADLLPRVFDLFVQGQSGLDRSQGGLGLGLTVVRRLAELHGGSVAVASDGPGRGAMFTVSLPRIAQPASRAAGQPAAVAIPPRRVLIVEDNEDAREMLRNMLELAGHHVRTAPDGPGGVTAALSHLPEVALIDLGLPGLDGYEVARQIRKTDAGRRMRLIAVTGYGQPEDRRRTEDAGFHAHLVKPVDVAQLMAVLALPAPDAG